MIRHRTIRHARFDTARFDTHDSTPHDSTRTIRHRTIRQRSEGDGVGARGRAEGPPCTPRVCVCVCESVCEGIVLSCAIGLVCYRVGARFTLCAIGTWAIGLVRYRELCQFFVCYRVGALTESTPRPPPPTRDDSPLRGGWPWERDVGEEWTDSTAPP